MSRSSSSPKRSLPVVEEQATVIKSKQTKRTILLHKRVHEEEAEIEAPLHAIGYEIRRVPCDCWVDAPVPVRTEGTTTIYPVLEEVAVVEKRLKLVEEVHVTREESERRFAERVALKREQIAIEKTNGGRGKPGHRTGR